MVDRPYIFHVCSPDQKGSSSWCERDSLPPASGLLGPHPPRLPELTELFSVAEKYRSKLLAWTHLVAIWRSFQKVIHLIFSESCS